MTNLKTRRDFLKTSAKGLGSLALFPYSSIFGQTLPASEDLEKHFFIQLNVRGGWDTRYLLDARPLEFRVKNLMHDYSKSEPEKITSSNGQSLWLSPSANSLKEHLSDCCIVNGVIMQHTGPDGHDLVSNEWFTGSQMGGLCFLPLFNKTAQKKSSLDAISLGANFPKAFTNLSHIPHLSFGNASKLSQIAPIEKFPALEFAMSRMEFLSNGTGQISRAAKLMSQNFKSAPELVTRLRSLTPPTVEGSTPLEKMISALHLSLDSFKKGVAKSALITTFDSTEFGMDTHAFQSAQQMPSRMKNVADLISSYFKILKTTPFDDTKSFFDVCTILVTSEFSRTLYQGGKSLDETGTDHNSLNNTVILAGKGVRRGTIIGQSDWQNVDEVLDPAHLGRDSSKRKLIGRAFDFNLQQNILVPQLNFDPSNYIIGNSVINTLLKIFQVPEEFYRKIERNGTTAKILTSALASL